jgi:hypothetical protein
MAEDEDGEKPAKLPVLPKREGGSLYGTTLYVQLFCTYVQRLKYSTSYVRVQEIASLLDQSHPICTAPSSLPFVRCIARPE